MTETASATNPSDYLLLDPLAVRIAAVWSKLPADLLDDGSYFEIATAASRLINADHSEVRDRVEMMLQLGLVKWDGTVDPELQKRLDQLGAQYVQHVLHEDKEEE